MGRGSENRTGTEAGGWRDWLVQDGMAQKRPNGRFDEVVAQSLEFKPQFATDTKCDKELREGPGFHAAGDWSWCGPGELVGKAEQVCREPHPAREYQRKESWGSAEKKQAELGAVKWVIDVTNV